MSLRDQQGGNAAIISNASDAWPSLSVRSSAPIAPSLARRAQRAVSSSLRIPYHVWQRQSLLPLPLPPAHTTQSCPPDAFISFYDPIIMQQGVVWRSHNSSEYSNAALFHSCLLHWEYQHFANLTDCSVFMILEFARRTLQTKINVGLADSSLDPTYNKMQQLQEMLNIMYGQPALAGNEVYFASHQGHHALPGRTAEDLVEEIVWDIDQGVYLMSVDTRASNASWTVGRWGAFEQIQKWREFGRRGWLTPLPSTWQTDMAQRQIELWLNTMVACQHHSRHSQAFTESCQHDCIRRPGGACLFQTPHLYNFSFVAGDQLSSRICFCLRRLCALLLSPLIPDTLLVLDLDGSRQHLAGENVITGPMAEAFRCINSQ